MYGSIESEVLPAPPDATVKNETAALIGCLPLRDAEYYDWFGKYKIIWKNMHRVRFATDEEWGPPPPGKENIEPNLTLTTTINLISKPEDGSYLSDAVRTVEPLGPRSKRYETVAMDRGCRNLLGVPGTPIRSPWLLGMAKGYAYNPGQQADVREKIGKALTQDPSVCIDTRTTISTPGLFLLAAGGPAALNLQSEQTYRNGHADTQPTQTELVVPHLRVVRALVSRGQFVPTR